MKRTKTSPQEELAESLIGILKGTPSDNAVLPDPHLLTYYKDESERIIWIDSEIDESILDVIRLILAYNREDKNIPVEQRKPIKLLLYSYGGDGQACFGLIDVIAMSKTPVYTVNMGVAMSAGLLILLAGHKRFCMPRSTALAHSGSGGTSGTFEQTEAQMKDYQHFVKMMRDYISERTTIDAKTLAKNKGKEWYLYAEDQLAYHVVDEIVTDLDLIN
ncbi:MAG: ATP-dependent Clp protease proteolytic subunit [Methanobrevibacter sp.]|nr:ATP-dependent Clp protease proteolytic subunit [Methanobrevibacter sp.]